MHQLGLRNRFVKKTYRVEGLADAAASQQTNLDVDKVETAVSQALSLWSAVAPLTFVPALSATADISVRFVNNGQTGDLGNGLGDINIGNKLFVDLWHERDFLPSVNGPFDLIGVIAHEVGHQLGIDHPPLMPGTDMETAPGALMSRSMGSKSLRRTLQTYDIDEVQRLYGRLSLSQSIPTSLQENSSINETIEGVHFLKASFGVQLDGPVGTSINLYVAIPNVKYHQINSVTLNFTTASPNCIVNTVELFDGIIPLQKYYVSARIGQYESNQIKNWTAKLGLMKRPMVKNPILAKINVAFQRFEGDTRWDYGVVQFTSITADPVFEFEIAFPTQLVAME